MFLLFNIIFIIILNKDKVKFTNNIHPIILGRTGNRFKQIVSLFERENLLNQTRISIPDTPERNKSINKTTYVADTPPGRDVDFSINTDSVNNNPITDAAITITSLVQDHINRHTQNLIANPRDQFNIETINPQDQLNPPDIQTDNP